MDISLTVLIAAQLITLAPASPAAQPLSMLPTPTEVARAQDVIYSDAYLKRLAVHRTASVAMLPLFALQVAAGTQLYVKGSAAPQWAKVGHRIGATGVAALFVTNVVTGVPNLVAGRRDPDGGGRRFFHAAMMLTASAGFTATGLLAERAESSPDDRDLHRTVALTSVAIATIGYLSMLDVFRPD